MGKEKPIFNFFADVGDTIVFGNRLKNVGEKRILNFFADVGERIVFRNRVTSIPIEDKRILTAFAHFGDKILDIPEKSLDAFLEGLEFFAEAVQHFLHITRQLATRFRWTLVERVLLGMRRTEAALEFAITSGRPDQISSVTKKLLLSPRGSEVLALRLRGLSFPQNPVLQEAVHRILETVEWSLWFHNTVYSDQQWRRVPYLEASTRTDFAQQSQLERLKGRDVFFRSELGWAYALEFSTVYSENAWYPPWNLSDTGLFWIAFCANPRETLRRVRGSEELVAAARNQVGLWRGPIHFHEFNLLSMRFVLPELGASINLAEAEQILDNVLRRTWASPEILGNVLVSNVFAWALQSREGRVIREITELIQTRSWELSPFIRFVVPTFRG